MHKARPGAADPHRPGSAHLLSRVPLPGMRATAGVIARSHPERDKRVAAVIVVLAALAAATSLAWTGRLTPPGSFSAIPDYWHDAADWLTGTQHRGTGTRRRVLVAPGARSPPRCGATATTSHSRYSVRIAWG